MKAEKLDHMVINSQPENNISVYDLVIRTPNDQVLLGINDEHFIHGNSYVIKGESGIGKSTFIRAIAGVWPYASGEVIFPENKHVMYLPQQPYIPVAH